MMFHSLQFRVLCGIVAALCAMTSAQAQSPNAIVNAAAQALHEGKFDEAVSLYEKARKALPNHPEIPYNLGVAHYRAGHFDKAAESFEQAMSLSNSDSLRSRSIYNMGNSAYAQSLKALKEQGDATQSQNQLNRATELLKDALAKYKKAMDADPTDEDARANAERSHQFLKQLEELQKQQQQQSQDQQQQDQQQQQQDQNQQSQQNQQQQEQQQQNQEQQSQEQQQNQPNSAEKPQEQNQPEPQSSEDDQTDQQQPQPSQPDQNKPPEQEQSAQEQPKPAAEQPDEKPPQEQGEHVQHPPKQPENRTMSRTEAERLLQSVRDKERRRRAELSRREQVKHSPVEKDW